MKKRKETVRLLDAKPYFSYKNYSVPKNDPIHNAPYDWQLKEAIKSHTSWRDTAS